MISEADFMAEPKCPDCGVVGLKKVVSTESAQQSKDDDAWFEIVLCDDCGHVYGVFAKQIYLCASALC
jgi:uncharacterized Zn finger protein